MIGTLHRLEREVNAGTDSRAFAVKSVITTSNLQNEISKITNENLTRLQPRKGIRTGGGDTCFEGLPSRAQWVSSGRLADANAPLLFSGVK